MHSIRAKVTTLTIVAVLLSVMLIGAMCIGIAKRDAEQSSEQLMELLCEAKSDEINNYLGSIEEAAKTVSRFSYELLDGVALHKGGVIGVTGSGKGASVERTDEQREGLDKYLYNYLDQTKAVFRTIADSNPNILTYYFRVNPEISTDVGGYWYSRHRSTSFEMQQVTDVRAYNVDDISHVGWYYQPLEKGRPLWLDPYHNDNMDEDIVSYVVPLYRYGTFLGIIGIDVSYASLIDEIDDIQVLESGYAFLTDSKGKIVYHPDLEVGLLLSDVNSELESSKRLDQSVVPITYKFGNTEKKAVWGTLTNGLRLIVSAPVSEINAGWFQLTLLIVAAALAIMAAFAFVATAFARRITGPLEMLADASTQLAEGNYNVELADGGNDEVGVLTRSFAHMRDELRSFIDDLNSRAYRDALTGVRNKGSFNLIAHRFDEIITYADTENVPSFAVVMFDCNDLKLINDTYGHDKGDVYLRTACQLICDVFAHSPVFRLGGDEFGVILQQSDLLNYEELSRIFDARARVINDAAQSDWEKINVARGMAEYDPLVDKNTESVMRRADMAMYENKRSMKHE